MITPVCLVILDGFGLAEPGPGNAVSLAATPVFDGLCARYDTTTLEACGEAVGLPAGQMGNSEVGHLNLGAGAVVKQDLLRIDEAVAAGELAANPVLRQVVLGAERVHLIGLASDGGVHSSDGHLLALIDALAAAGVPDTVVHAFSDGRDVSPHQAGEFFPRLDASPARVGSVIGRFYAMDRDQRWERIERARALLVDGEAPYSSDSAEAAVEAAYARGETDEFIEPTLVGADARIRPQDAVIAFNFRPDRMRELTEALAHDPARYATMTRYAAEWDYPVLFEGERPRTTLPLIVAEAGLGQLHVAETEKYPHVTYFFGGGAEEAYPGETRELVPSPRDVKTYDERPEMSARAATDAFVDGWEAGAPAFAIINFANPDMVGHTGVIPAAVTACEVVDDCLGRVVAAVSASGGVCIVTADHGNCDEMLDGAGQPQTAHSLNPVPMVVTRDGVRLDGPGILADVAPTALALMGIEQPEAMTGRSLIRG